MAYNGGVCITYGDGRLGNILFEAATGAYWAKKNGMPYYYRHVNFGNTYYYMNPLKSYFTKINWINSLDDVDINHDYYNLTFREIEITNYTEIPDIPADYKYPVNVVIEGTRLNPRYFTKEFALEYFGPSEDILNHIRSLYPNVDFEQVVSVHVRRGDFMNYQTEYIGFNLNPLDFYRKIFSLYSRDQKYVIITEPDDMKWCKENFIGDNFIFADKISDKYDNLLIDLYLPTLCKDNVISCSSFGWWGAYLNLHKGRKVFYESPWYNWNFDYGLGIIPDEPDWIAIQQDDLDFDDFSPIDFTKEFVFSSEDNESEEYESTNRLIGYHAPKREDFKLEDVIEYDIKL